MQMIKITTDLEKSLVDLTFDELWNIFNSPVEHVLPRRLQEPYCMLIDEEGILKDLPVNLVGSYFYEFDKHGCPIVGDIYIAKDGYFGGEPDIVGLDENDIKVLDCRVDQIIEDCKGLKNII